MTAPFRIPPRLARRLTGLALALAVALPALPAASACLNRDSAATGVTFTRQDGSRGMVKRTPSGLVVDYDIGPTEWDDRREGRDGVFETGVVQLFSHLPLVGSGATTTSWSFSPKPPAIEPLTGFRTTLTGRWRQETGTEKGYDKGTFRGTAEYRFLAEDTARLSGCEYRIVPVEATFKGDGRPAFQRWIYFPDLGFGIETRSDDRKLGLTALKAM